MKSLKLLVHAVDRGDEIAHFIPFAIAASIRMHTLRAIGYIMNLVVDFLVFLNILSLILISSAYVVDVRD